MAEFVVHSVAGSPYGRAVLATLEEKGAPYRMRPVALGAFRQPEHLERHPFAKVPVLEHDGFRLYETQAILRYIDRVRPEPTLTPPDPRRAARMDQLLNVNDWYLFHGFGAVVGFHRVVAPRLLGLAPDEGAIAAALPKGQVVMAELARQLGEDSFLTGSDLTLADLLVACHLDLLAETPEWEPLTAAHPHLRAWLERMSTRPSLQATTWDRVAEMARAA